MSEGSVYRCPSCGAPADPKAAACAYCAAKLQPVRCPWCFEWTDAAAKGCPRCGAESVAPAADARSLSCPSCGEAAKLSTRALGGARLAGCMKCAGLWADVESFKRLCEDHAAQSAYLGQGSPLSQPGTVDPSQAEIRYHPCAECGELMNRFNFADCSGVILDACKPHGVWFDADELRRIVEFIVGGGFDVARGKELLSLQLERHLREQAGHGELAPMPEFLPLVPGFKPPVPDHIASARGLLAQLLGMED